MYIVLSRFNHRTHCINCGKVCPPWPPNSTHIYLKPLSDVWKFFDVPEDVESIRYCGGDHLGDFKDWLKAVEKVTGWKRKCT